MKPGAIIEIEDRGRATVVYHQLEGYGIVWGEVDVDPANLPEPEAMLREQEYQHLFDYECVGKSYCLIREGSFEYQGEQPNERDD